MLRRELVTSITPEDTASTKNTTEETTTLTILDSTGITTFDQRVAPPRKTLFKK